ncbi:membrane protein [Flavobacterium lutivivi]|nr:membrane protein [Flavobacterium lutivivi]
MEKDMIKEGKTAAIISYILIVGPLISLSMNSENKNKYAAFHIRQGLGLTLSFIILGVSISYFENIYIAASMWIFISVLAVYGIFSAASGSTKPLPLLGSIFQKVFKSL